MENMNWIISVSNHETHGWTEMAKTWHPSVALQIKEGLEDMGLECRVLHQVGNVRLKEELTWDKALELGKFMEELREYENEVYERING